MSLQLKKKNYKFTTATTGALIIGAGFIVFKTFPHLKSALYSALGASATENNIEGDNTPIEITNNDEVSSEALEASVVDESIVDITSWSDDNLKSYLVEVSINSFTASKSDTNDIRKKSVLLPMLLTMALYPLLSQFKRVFDLNINIFITLKAIMFRILIVLRGFLK